jgi:hypothetical protein
MHPVFCTNKFLYCIPVNTIKKVLISIFEPTEFNLGEKYATYFTSCRAIVRRYKVISYWIVTAMYILQIFAYIVKFRIICTVLCTDGFIFAFLCAYFGGRYCSTHVLLIYIIVTIQQESCAYLLMYTLCIPHFNKL